MRTTIAGFLFTGTILAVRLGLAPYPRKNTTQEICASPFPTGGMILEYTTRNRQTIPSPVENRQFSLSYPDKRYTKHGIMGSETDARHPEQGSC